jgi:CheY-like chemotaxis protein
MPCRAISRKVWQAGFFRYLTKPIKVNEFMETLDVALRFARAELARAATRGTGMITESEILDASILIVDDQESNVLLLEQLLSEAGYRRVASTMDPRECVRCTASTATT